MCDFGVGCGVPGAEGRRLKRLRSEGDCRRCSVWWFCRRWLVGVVVGDVGVRRVGALVLRVVAGGVLGVGVLLVVPVLGQSTVVPVITSEVSFVVAEGSVSVATLSASDDDTVVGDLVWTPPG